MSPRVPLQVFLIVGILYGFQGKEVLLWPVWIELTLLDRNVVLAEEGVSLLPEEVRTKHCLSTLQRRRPIWDLGRDRRGVGGPSSDGLLELSFLTG